MNELRRRFLTQMSIGMFLVAFGQIMINMMATPDFLSGLTTGVGLGLMIFAYIKLKKELSKLTKQNQRK